MPVTRSEAMFFTGGLVAGVAVVAALPWLQKRYEALRNDSQENGGGPGGELGRKLSETVEELMKHAPDYVDAGKSGLQAGFEAACRMAQTIARPGEGAESKQPVADPSQAA